MNRRAFLARLGFGTVAAAAAATGVLDVERLLWTPGEKTIFIPPAPLPLSEMFRKGDMFTIAGRFAINPWTQKPTQQLQAFIVTSDVHEGGLLQVEALHPRIMRSGAYRNVTGPKQGPVVDARDVTRGWGHR